MLYENAYVWLVFVSCLDIMMTWIVLHSGGREGNTIAASVIERFGLPGLVLFKLAIVVFVVILSEVIGRRRIETGRKFIRAAAVLSSAPVAIAFWLLS